jgi:hypothetical protein
VEAKVQSLLGSIDDLLPEYSDHATYKNEKFFEVEEVLWK